MRLQAPAERQQALDNLDAHLSDFLTDSHESSLFMPTECRELERETENCRERCQTLQVSLETGKILLCSWVYWLLAMKPYDMVLNFYLFFFSGEGWVGLSCLPLRAAEHQVPSGGCREQTDAWHTDSTPQHNIRRHHRQCSSHSRARGEEWSAQLCPLLVNNPSNCVLVRICTAFSWRT